LAATVKTQEPFKVEFHPEAGARFTELAQEVMKSVRSFGSVENPPTGGAEIHPVANIAADQVIGEIKVIESSVNALGEETGRYWTSNGLRVGWQGPEFEAIKDLALRFGNTKPIKGRVSNSFLLDEIFKWLKETLEAKRSDTLPEHIAERCSSEIKDYEIWVPVYRTYSAADFEIGNVEFRTVSKALLDQWYAHVPEDEAKKPEVAQSINRKRARIQGGIAACIRMKAEVSKAREIAQSAASEAVGFLRFLSPVNWTCKLVSHCLPVGKENTRQAMELLVEDGAIRKVTEASIEEGPAGWNVDEARHMSPGLLEALHKLALHRENSEFKRDLYGALQLHSRHSVAAETLHKIVLVASAIESLLLRDTREPIQKNLGERMAFITGNSLDERKGVVTNVEEFYRIRSAFFHHGQSVSPMDAEIVDKFFFNVWFCLGRLLLQVDQYETKDKLLAVLEERKLS
jgi:hypothetical protein